MLFFTLMIFVDISDSENTFFEFHIFLGICTLAFLMIFLFFPKGYTIILDENYLKIIISFNSCCCHYTKTFKYDILDRIEFKRLYKKG